MPGKPSSPTPLAISGLLFFFVLAIFNLVSEYLEWRTGIFISKPLLMPVLALYLFLSSGFRTTFNRWIGLALLFSFGGDTLLLFSEQGQGTPLFFLLGLGSFLMAHLFYILAFSRYQRQEKGWLRTAPWALLPFVLYLAWLLNFLWEDIPGDMRIPVSVYGLVIISVCLAAVNLKTKVAKQIFWLFFIGILLFVLSDSLIALNKFKGAAFYFPKIRLWIMGLYITGQFLITEGAIRLSSGSAEV
jgi:uncharacterized membrane protein YhhN